MRKILFALTLCIATSLFAYAPAYAAETTETPKYLNTEETVVSTKGLSQEANYKANLELMNNQSTDPKLLALWLRPSYEIESDNADIIALAKSITASSTDDYSKVQAIHNYVCNNIYYDIALSNSDDYGYFDGKIYNNADYIQVTGDYYRNYKADSVNVEAPIQLNSAIYVLKNKRGVCEGYTNLTCALLRAIGIPSQIYLGTAFNGTNWGGHAWSGAYISEQKKWIILDTTFDSSNEYTDGKYKAGGTSQKYFNPDLNTFSINHRVDAPLFFDELYFDAKNVSMAKYGIALFQPEIGDLQDRIGNYDSWVSSNPKVATVDQEGNVIAQDYGTVTISMAVLDGSGMTDSFTLTVEPQVLKSISAPYSMNIGTTSNLYVSAKSDYNDYIDAIGGEYAEDEEDTEDAEDYEDYEKSIYLTDEAVAFNKLHPLVLFDENDAKYLSWKSSNTKVITVDKTGKATAVGFGTATITATNMEGTCSVTANIEVEAVLSGISIAHKTYTVSPNSETEVLVNGSPNGSVVDDQYLSWKSSNPKVAIVDTSGDGTGILTAYKEGTTTITAYIWGYTSDDSEDSVILYEDTCVVTVVKQYKVTFDSEGGSKIKAVTATVNATITNPANPTRKGYKFVGWYKNSKYTKVWNFDTDKIKANTTLYAKWKKI